MWHLINNDFPHNNGSGDCWRLDTLHGSGDGSGYIWGDGDCTDKSSFLSDGYGDGTGSGDGDEDCTGDG